ncbi:MAG: type III-A CRISPR-associated RAMP protein Csm3 [Peptococcaceae bacterium]|jgi:CRISPR-associated protein Csm3|nr:type III-A CRISPR-associated RAMP protein Csm3 [Peptococcaceae bacterium]MDH7524145.1 type III-A CRISPR-associated RAMP protein Csm3 [Peptococcaceae bacterium]
MSNNINGICGKLILGGKICLKTGLHIGASKNFSSIGAVDMVVVRDPLTKSPYIPGSSLKGKMRYLLARVYAREGQLKDFKDEDDKLLRLFGSSGEKLFLSRLQFYDAFMTKESLERLKKMDTDLYLTEIKFENTIPRLSGIANPRQMERVPAGAEFAFKLVYNLEKPEELEEDMRHLGCGISLLQDDYIGGHGSRGCGRVEFAGITLEYKDYAQVSGKKALGFDVRTKAEEAFQNGRNGVVI